LVIVLAATLSLMGADRVTAAGWLDDLRDKLVPGVSKPPKGIGASTKGVGGASSGNVGSGSGRGTAAAGATGGKAPAASRIFSGPDKYPPSDFGAYAILAFQSKAAPQDMERHLAICEAYRTTVPHFSELDIPLSEQLVTVWPIVSEQNALATTAASGKDTCALAVEHYGLVASRKAIAHAEFAGVDIGVKRGPFLLAWSPTSKKGQDDAVVLSADLSGVRSLEQAKRVFRRWVRDIEEDSDLWNEDGWSVEKVKVVIGDWASEMGDKILFLFVRS
jgi:hypothetical protein